MAKIYLATSWKNPIYDDMLKFLRDLGHEVYDYREKGFVFSQITPNGVDPATLSVKEQAALLNNPIAANAFAQDYKALQACDVLVMLYPCGNDAHLELGYAIGHGKFTIIYFHEGYKVGLMDLLANAFAFNKAELAILLHGC